jgi:CBS domain
MKPPLRPAIYAPDGRFCKWPLKSALLALSCVACTLSAEAAPLPGRQNRHQTYSGRAEAAVCGNLHRHRRSIWRRGPHYHDWRRVWIDDHQQMPDQAPAIRVSEIATQKPLVAFSDEPLRTVVNRMAESGFTRFPVLDPASDGKIVGIVALNDLLHVRTRNLAGRTRP